jgi:hypothetical protein
MPDNMAASNPNNPAANNDPSHYFHAEAYALTGKLMLPFETQIKKQAFVKLEGDSKQVLLEAKGDVGGSGEETKKLREKRAQENYLSQHSKNYRLESIISYSAAHTQVSGHRSKKHPDRFVTLATSSVENLNILNVVTADRVVAQISTTHIPGQYSPEVTFLGTHFENLRIARRRTVPFLNLNLAGKPPKPKENANDEEKEKGKYYPTFGSSIMKFAEQQYGKMRTGVGKFLALLEPEQREGLFRGYDEFSEFNYGQLQERASAEAKKDENTEAPAHNSDKWEGVTCSLVEHVKIADGESSEIVVPGKDLNQPPALFNAPPACCFGHVIHVPDFGTIFLAELKVNHNSFHLTMIRTELGCIADGSGSFVTCAVNGKGSKGGP